MAKWGEGDPRWIVEERPDAVNVNNWHWTEKDATKWSEAKIRELLVGLTMKTDVIEVKITELPRMEGEASVNNRKAKLIFLYDWNLTLTWKGKLLSSSSDESTGSVNIPNLSDENTIDEVTVEVTLKESTSEGEIIKQYLHMEGQNIIREQLSIYLKLLKEEFSKGVILPKKDNDSSEDLEKQKQINKLSEGFNQKVQMNNSAIKSESDSLSKAEFTTLSTSYTFHCTGKEFYNSLTDPRMVTAFTRSSVVLEPRVGGKFELFGGNISGSFVQLVPNKLIVKKWRLKSWPKDHYSQVSLTIVQQEDHTLVTLSQTGVPKSDVDVLKNNWQLYYWDSIKQTFGFGYFL